MQKLNYIQDRIWSRSSSWHMRNSKKDMNELFSKRRAFLCYLVAKLQFYYYTFKKMEQLMLVSRASGMILKTFKKLKVSRFPSLTVCLKKGYKVMSNIRRAPNMGYTQFRPVTGHSLPCQYVCSTPLLKNENTYLY